MYINLLKSLPLAKKPISERLRATEYDKSCHWKLGKEYFDGTRQQGLGGYYYDGRWKPVAMDFINHYNLQKDPSVLDIGCAKGFFLYDFKNCLPKSSVFGLDISEYALLNAKDEINYNICMGNARKLPFLSNSFDLVVSINTLHNILTKDEVVDSLKEIERVGKKHKYISVGAYSNTEEKKRLDQWAVVATTYLHVDEWINLFQEANYTGDYFWFKP